MVASAMQSQQLIDFRRLIIAVIDFRKLIIAMIDF